MEHSESAQFVNPNHEEYVAPMEIEPTVAIDALPEALGVVQTVELRELRAHVVEALASEAGDEKRLALRYYLGLEAVVKQFEDRAFARAQIGLTVMMGLLRRDAGRLDAYFGDLEDAATNAYKMGADDIVAVLDAELIKLQTPQP